jgi:hypothetical protein
LAIFFFREFFRNCRGLQSLKIRWQIVARIATDSANHSLDVLWNCSWKFRPHTLSQQLSFESRKAMSRLTAPN